LERVQRERDLYRRLLDLGTREDLAGILEEALSLIVEVAGARKGYLALHRVEEDPATPRWWIARGCSEEEGQDIRQKISRGIIAEALATGRTIHTPSALHDPRFQEQESVQANQIQSVLCAPIGAPPLGVLYLQDRSASEEPFGEEDRERAEV